MGEFWINCFKPRESRSNKRCLLGIPWLEIRGPSNIDRSNVDHLTWYIMENMEIKARHEITYSKIKGFLE